MESNKTNLAPHKKNGAKILLDALSIVAEKNATVLCRGLMYEPEIPRKLKK
ncbi:MAG: cyclic lactone autoinducer peptide [Lachnospiraceae bacterium]|nr:cyclic lactone autoinducer peptide [Lachnospiraceae bacterium]